MEKETDNRPDDVELCGDLTFERRWWRTQHFGWVVLTLLLLGGLIGVFGHGPLSEATTSPPGSGMQVVYHRLTRRETPELLQLQLDKTTLAFGQVRIRLNRALIEEMQLKQIIPEPMASEPLADGARFVFRTDSVCDAAVIVFIVNPTKPGFVESEVAIEGAKPVRFRQFVYP